jgi:hypothetical protein
MELVSPDRRVLKAFYTQYVAVLLIILTFTIGAFRRSLPSQEVSAIPPLWTPRAVVGAISIEDLFTAEGSVNEQNPRVRAVAEVLKNHDLLMRATYLVPRLEFDRESVSLKRALRRLEALREYLRSQSVPDAASILLVRAADEGASTVSVQFLESREGG